MQFHLWMSPKTTRRKKPNPSASFFEFDVIGFESLRFDLLVFFVEDFDAVRIAKSDIPRNK